MCRVVFFFFFSSRRRHTRFDCDWSSDVCSSDLVSWGRARPQVRRSDAPVVADACHNNTARGGRCLGTSGVSRSEEHTSELQSQSNLVCRLLLEKKKQDYKLIQVATVSVRTDLEH